MPKPSALVILPEAPYPAVGGGPLRSACMLAYLSERYCLSALNFRLKGRPDPALRFPPGSLEASCPIDLPDHSKRFLPRAARNLLRGLRGIPPLMDRFGEQDAVIKRFLQDKQFDLIWLEHFWVAPYVDLLRPHARTLVLDLHNIESRLFHSLLPNEPVLHRPLLRRFEQCSIALERKLFPLFDQVIVTSKADADRADRLGAKRVLTVPNTIPWQPLPSVERGESIVFSGNFEYQPNQQGLRWFLAECWPLILQAVPTLRLRLVGVGIEFAARQALGKPNIDLIGPVPDAVQEIGKSRIAIVPLLAGSGTRLKILEAWAAGTAVVSTPIGAEGLDAIPDVHVKIASGANSFMQSVVTLVQNKEECSRLATQARLLFERAYTWSSAHQRLSATTL